jgi:transcriptional regulator with GAF, ATPase, and Fis domain
VSHVHWQRGAADVLGQLDEIETLDRIPCLSAASAGERLAHKLERAVALARRERSAQKSEDGSVLRAEQDEAMIAESPAMRRALDDISRAQSSSMDVLIEGETGTGKEVAAKLLHRKSPRRRHAFHPVDCRRSLLRSQTVCCLGTRAALLLGPIAHT